MKRTAWLGVVLLLAATGSVRAFPVFTRHRLDRINQRLHGVVVDYTRNHGCDRRIWSPSLCEKRDLYVYLPPGYDPHQRYPVMIWLHGFAQDEQQFLEDVAVPLDEAIGCGKLPPFIIAAPDGSFDGHACLITAGSFFLNSKAGRFEDFIMCDLWDFLHEHYPIRPEREAHVLAGVSMGGGAAFNLAFKHRERVGVILGVLPPLNPRWVDCHCNGMADFDPCCWGWRNDFSRKFEVVGRFYCVFTIRMRSVVGRLFGHGPEVPNCVSAENPAEHLARLDIKPGEFAMHIAYAGRDEFNLDAQAESFLALAKQRGICPTVQYDPCGRHNRPTAEKMRPGVIAWIAEQIAPYAP